MKQDRPFLKAKFAVVDLAETVHLFELDKPIGFIKDKFGFIEVHLKGIPIPVEEEAPAKPDPPKANGGAEDG